MISLSVHHIFESENIRFSFSTKISLTQGVKYEKIKPQKIVGNSVNKLRKQFVPEWTAHLEIISRSQTIENSR